MPENSRGERKMITDKRKRLEKKFDFIIERHNLEPEKVKRMYRTLTSYEKRKFMIYYESLMN
jgi:hypothetical protein